MALTKHKILFTLFFILCGLNIYSTNVRNRILVISSYGSDYQWSNSIIDGIKVQVSKSNPEMELNVEYLSSERFFEPKIWIERINILLDNYNKKLPAAIILISDEAWMAYRDADIERFKDVPLLLCGVKLHSISIEKYIKNINNLTLNDFSSTKEVLKQYPNATAVIRETNVEGFINLMESLIPNIDRYTIITDSRFYGIYTHLLFDDYLKKSHSSRPVEYLDARFISSDTLLRKLRTIPPTSGVVMTSWLTGNGGFEYSKQYIYREMSSILKSPILITNDIGLITGYFLGGYFYEAQFWGDRTGKMLVDVLDREAPADIPIEVYKSKECKINWTVLDIFGISTDKLPSNTEYINLPESIFIKYSNQFIIAVVILLMIILSYIYILNSNIKLKRAQRSTQQAILEAHQSNQELIASQDKLKVALIKSEAADRLKSAFISNMDHEIRTPLNSIVGFSSLIVSMDDKEDMEEAAKQISENSEKLLQIIKGILDISQLEAGTAEFNYERMNINSMFSDLMGISSRKCRPDTQLIFSHPDIPLSIITDPTRVAQVMTTFISNAIKFTNQGIIEIGYFKYDEYWIEFFVKDTGIGMDQTEVAKIFERFYKSDTYVLGAGLGLPIAKQIIEVLGGRYGVSSELGLGSRFWFRLKNT